jgi:hypothetical protein
MPLISNIKHSSLQHHKEQEEIEATYDIIRRGGETFLQITTCGSPSRKCPGKASQVMRFNKQSIEQLKQIIQDNF